MQTVVQGDARTVLETLDEDLVQVCVTSPPYWGLRDYGCDGQLGLESTPDEYVATMVGVFREVRRVMRDDGTLWLNLGDSYAGSWGAQSRGETNAEVSGLSSGQVQAAPKRTHTGSMARFRPGAGRADGVVDDRAQRNRNGTPSTHGLKPKDLVGIPWRVAFALQADGWYLRSDIIWAKPNPMPESVRDRPTKSHEYLFLFSKAKRYYYDADAIAEPTVYPGDTRHLRTDKRKEVDPMCSDNGSRARTGNPTADMRNRRTVWTITPKPYRGAHFAVMPEALVEPCILAGSKVGDLVLDPFAGAGTVGVVAKRTGRAFLGIDLNPAYVEMATNRIDRIE